MVNPYNLPPPPSVTPIFRQVVPAAQFGAPASCEFTSKTWRCHNATGKRWTLRANVLLWNKKPTSLKSHCCQCSFLFYTELSQWSYFQAGWTGWLDWWTDGLMGWWTDGGEQRSSQSAALMQLLRTEPSVRCSLFSCSAWRMDYGSMCVMYSVNANAHEYTSM